AMTFALFGVVPGARDVVRGELKSAWADPSARCEVRLDFSLGEKLYRVARSPAQTRAKKRGGGLTQDRPEAKLFLVDALTGGRALRRRRRRRRRRGPRAARPHRRAVQAGPAPAAGGLPPFPPRELHGEGDAPRAALRHRRVQGRGGAAPRRAAPARAARRRAP